MKTIGYVSRENPFTDRKAWSGTIYKIREAIELAGFKVIWIPYSVGKTAELAIKSYMKLRYGKAAITNHNRYIYRQEAKSISQSLIDECDYLFFPGGIQISAFRNLGKPLIYYADATIRIMMDYYFKNQHEWIKHEAERCERMGISNASLCIMSSDWAANSVVNDYHFQKERTFVLEFGANLDDEDIVDAAEYDDGRLRMLLSGVDWDRKGGADAVEAVRLLNEKGVDAHLTIVGMTNLPKYVTVLPYVTVVGFLNKNDLVEYKRYVDIIKASNLLILPTKAECAGIVYCEACAYGLPIFTRCTGGTANYCIDGVNGRNLQENATAEDFANAIYEGIKNHKLKEYSENAKQIYINKLSWSAWVQKFAKIMNLIFK